MKKTVISFISIVLAITIFVSMGIDVSAMTDETPFKMPTHLHIGDCSTVCEIEKNGTVVTTYKTICNCGYEMGDFNMCEPVCDHNFETSYRGKTFESDVCGLCGYLRLHKSTETMLFVTRKNKVDSHSQPYEASEVQSTYNEEGTSVSIIGRVRNKYNNLWLLLSDGSYVWADNLAFDLDSTMAYSGQYIRSTIMRSDKNQTESFISAMISSFKSGGKFDFKKTNMLGANTYNYYILVGGEVQKERLTGEDIGNINYGFVAAAFGLGRDNAIKLGGLGAMITAKDIGKLISNGTKCVVDDIYACDDENDITAVKRGWNYYKTGKWT